jgi:hypothetical protein
MSGAEIDKRRTGRVDAMQAYSQVSLDTEEQQAA